MRITVKIIVALIIASSQLFAGGLVHVEIKARSGDATYLLFIKYELILSKCNLDYFREINKLPEDLNLIRDKVYKLPVLVYNYNSVSIRSTIGNKDLTLAKKIQAYNEAMLKKGLRKVDYRKDNILWVPYDYMNCSMPSTTGSTGTMVCPILGEAHKNIRIRDNRLTGCVYYIVAGHGGPDPGAMGKYNGHTLCEDEYAYDIALRMTQNLLEHGATVYVINRDKNDGIRDAAILEPDNDEVFYRNKRIPLNQVSRLDLACSVINELYQVNKKQGVKKQRVINLHLDSRGSGQRVDMFFYYKAASNEGKELAIALKNTIEEKYNHHQKSRGYQGSVKPRNLHMLRKTVPVSVFIELGNIRNSADQKRFILKENRQAVANWLVDGLIKEN
jgi:N-acetylmuramoyl-L-alanine amidase